MSQPCYTCTGVENMGIHGPIDVIEMLNRQTGQKKRFPIGTPGWRILFQTQFRANSESPSQTSREIGWDVQQDIAHMVFFNQYLGGE